MQTARPSVMTHNLQSVPGTRCLVCFHTDKWAWFIRVWWPWMLTVSVLVDYQGRNQVKLMCTPNGNVPQSTGHLCHIVSAMTGDVLATQGTKVQRYWSISPGGWFNIKIPSYQYRKSHCGDKTVVRSSYLHNGISYTGKMTSLYWIRVLASLQQRVNVLSFDFSALNVYLCVQMALNSRRLWPTAKGSSDVLEGMIMNTLIVRFYSDMKMYVWFWSRTYRWIDTPLLCVLL